MKPYPMLLYALSRLRWRITRPVTLGVRLLLVKDRSVLLVRHTYQPYWFLVGGGVGRHETLQEAARREIVSQQVTDIVTLAKVSAAFARVAG